MELSDFNEGAVVEVFGLVVRKDLNGEKGPVVCAQERRLVIRLGSGDVAVRPKNCKIVGGKRKAVEREQVKLLPQSKQRKADTASPPPPQGLAAAQLAAGSGTQQQDLLGAMLLIETLQKSGPMLAQVLKDPMLQELSLSMLRQGRQEQQNDQNSAKAAKQAMDEAHDAGNEDASSGRCLLVVFKGVSGVGAEPAVEELFWVLSQFGVVEKVSVFWKKSDPHALVQYGTPEEATRAMGYLHGKNCFEAELAIMESSYRELPDIPKADSKLSDFKTLNDTIRGIPEGQRYDAAKTHDWAMKEFLWGVSLGTGWLTPQQDAGFKGKIPRGGLATQGKVGDCISISGLPADINATKLWNLAGVYGKLVAVKILQKRTDCALVQYTDSYAANNSIAQLNGCVLGGNKLGVVPSKHSSARNWRGAVDNLNQYMVTSSDRVPPESYLISPRPSKSLTFNVPKGVGGEKKRETKLLGVVCAHMGSLCLTATDKNSSSPCLPMSVLQGSPALGCGRITTRVGVSPSSPEPLLFFET